MKSQGLLCNVKEKGHRVYELSCNHDQHEGYVVGRVGSIGRAEDIQVPLRDRTVSRRHCRIYNHPYAGWVVEDLGSSNGTWIVSMEKGRRRLQRVTRPTPVNVASLLHVGETDLRLRALHDDQDEAFKEALDDGYDRFIEGIAG